VLPPDPLSRARGASKTRDTGEGGEGTERRKKTEAKVEREWRRGRERKRLRAMCQVLMAEVVTPEGRLEGL